MALTELADQVVIRGEVTSIYCCFFGMENNDFNYQLIWFRRNIANNVSEGMCHFFSQYVSK